MNTHSRILLVALLAVAGAAAVARTTVGPDAAGYVATDDTAFGFVDIAATGVRALAGVDDDTREVPLGFAFEFYGQTHTSACVSTNGFLTLGGCADAFANQDLTATATPGGLPVIAPFWTDLTFLRPNAGGVYYETLGVAPDRQFVVQWTSAFPQNAARPVTVQAVLSEGSGDIRFQYESVDAGAGDPASAGGTATVGICDGGGHLNGRCLQWSHAAPVLAARSAIVFGQGAGPVAPPVIEGLQVSPSRVWPPNNQMIDVAVRYTASAGGAPVSCTLDVASSLPAGGPRGPAWVVVDAERVRVRATRPGNARDGLVYTITVTCTSAGGSSTASATVTVPHDQGRR